MTDRSKKHVHLAHSLTVSDAIQTLLRHNLDYLSKWEQAARSSDTIEGVHQTRVAFRRMRSALTIFRVVIPKEVSKSWSSEMRDLSGRLGKARDLDVFIDEALGGVRGKLFLPGDKGLEVVAYKHREAAYDDARRMLDSDQYAQFKEGFGSWIDSKGWEQAELRKKQRRLMKSSLSHFARKVLDRQERRVLEAGANVDKYSAEAMHRLRIECKKLRYAAEFFLSVFSGMSEFIGHMKGLQNLLGVMNDVSVMHSLMGELLDGVEDREVLLYAGAVMGWRTCYYEELLGGFDRRWEEFVDAKHPWWKKSATHQSMLHAERADSA